MKLRKRIANSPALNRAFAKLIAGYVWLVWKTARWDIRGMEAMRDHLASGTPLIAALWHQRLLMSPYLFPRDAGAICSLTSEARGGRLAGQVQREFGFDTIAMAKSKRHVALSRDVVRKMAQGVSIGIAVDGPNGPARQAQTVPLVWARMSGKPIYLVTYSMRRHRLLATWDRAMLPFPFSRGVILCRKLEITVPRKMDAAKMDHLRLRLQQELDALTLEADLAAGHRLACL